MLNRSFEIIEEIKDIIKKSFVIPILERVVIDYNKLMLLIRKLDETLPEELAEARKIVRKRDEIIKEAQEEAQNIIRYAREKADNLLNENNITKEARIEAEEIIKEAKKEADEIKKEAENYTLFLLGKVEEVLRRELEIIDKCKDELKM